MQCKFVCMMFVPLGTALPLYLCPLLSEPHCSHSLSLHASLNLFLDLLVVLWLSIVGSLRGRELKPAFPLLLTNVPTNFFWLRSGSACSTALTTLYFVLSMPAADTSQESLY